MTRGPWKLFGVAFPLSPSRRQKTSLDGTETSFITNQWPYNFTYAYFGSLVETVET